MDDGWNKAGDALAADIEKDANPYVQFEDRIADAVFDVLTDRKGFRYWWDDIDDDIRAEIRGEVARAAIAQVIA